MGAKQFAIEENKTQCRFESSVNTLASVFVVCDKRASQAAR
jgi:hypothetical protein